MMSTARPEDCWQASARKHLPRTCTAGASAGPTRWMEFVLGWLSRRPLPDSDREAPIVWDSGSSTTSTVTSPTSSTWRSGTFGDPMMRTSAGSRMHDSIVPFSDFKQIYRALRGADRGRRSTGPAIHFRRIFFTLTNHFMCHTALAEPTVDTNYMTYSHSVSEGNLYTVAAMAEVMGMKLEPVESPDDEVGVVGVGGSREQLVVRSLRTIEVNDEFTRYHGARSASPATCSATAGSSPRRWSSRGARRPPAPARSAPGRRRPTGEAGRLERFVLADAAPTTRRLVVLMRRQSSRSKALIGPASSAIATHLPIQPFGA